HAKGLMLGVANRVKGYGIERWLKQGSDFTYDDENGLVKFLNKEISFGQIIPILEKSIPHAQGRTVSSLEDIIALNQEIRIRSHL
ncbi:MAG TPA: hypothetical protein PKZ89_07200, partial [Alphaproteobacteria bacterium]|nr:hypothetical protein [Alphaproteobacteria bacterium]